MNFARTIIILSVMAFVYTESIAQKKGKKSKNIVAQLYDGTELPPDQVVKIISNTVDKSYLYFINVDDKKVLENNPSLTKGAQEIMLLPGNHTIQMRFSSAKGNYFPVQPFEPVLFDAGVYDVKFEYTEGNGSYITAAMSARLRLWIEREGKIIIEKMVNGMGESIE